MPFPYYERLSKRDQATYRKSDQHAAIGLPPGHALAAVAAAIGEALGRSERSAVQAAAQRLCDGITGALRVDRVTVQVLDVRPHSRREELHGLYTSIEGRSPRIRIWMRTAKQGRVVAFRTFVRTLLHEVCHHLDFTLLALEESFHTEGFFKRESSLVRQLLPPREVG